MRRDHEALMHESACADGHAGRQTTARGTKGSGSSQPTLSWLGKDGLGTSAHDNVGDLTTEACAAIVEQRASWREDCA